MRPLEREIEDMMNIVAELDWSVSDTETESSADRSLLAFARAVSSYSLVRPKMVEKPVLEIRRGRHILQERYVERYVTNDTFMQGGGGDEQRNMVRTLPC